ncbi:hypothetical protein LO771_13450 [Streptacidiphilus sp. ASG 303]|nr:hypothetical protein [Streptacidiphilus sp. ASG 303]
MGESTWSDPVLCLSYACGGGVTPVRDIHTADSLPGLPSEQVLAVRPAARTGMPALRHAGTLRPSAHRVATPGGTVARARVHADDACTSLTVDRVEPGPLVPHRSGGSRG